MDFYLIHLFYYRCTWLSASCLTKLLNHKSTHISPLSLKCWMSWLIDNYDSLPAIAPSEIGTVNLNDLFIYTLIVYISTSLIRVGVITPSGTWLFFALSYTLMDSFSSPNGQQFPLLGLSSTTCIIFYQGRLVLSTNRSSSHVCVLVKIDKQTEKYKICYESDYGQCCRVLAAGQALEAEMHHRHDELHYLSQCKVLLPP